MKTLNPASLEWKIAFDLGYWRAIYLADRARFSDPAFSLSAKHRSLAVADIAREAAKGMSRAKRRAFGAQIRSAFNSTLEWKRGIRAAA